MGINKKLGKLSLAILENFVGKSLGENFIEELRGSYQQYENIILALANSEKRFLSEFSDKELSKALFIDLSQTNRPCFRKAIQSFYSHPTDPTFYLSLKEILFNEFSALGADRIEAAVTTYADIYRLQFA